MGTGARGAGRPIGPLLRAAAALILAAAAWRMLPADVVPDLPGRGQLALSESLLHGLAHPDAALQMPMESAASALSFGHAGSALRWWAPSLLWTGTMVLVFTLGSLMLGPLCGGLAALLAAPSMAFGVHYMSVYAFLVLLAANALAWAARSPGAWRWAAVGLALGLTLLQRSSLFLFPILLAAYLWQERRSRGEPGRPAELALTAALPFLPLLPWVRMNWLLYHKFIPFENVRAESNIIAGALGAVFTQEGEVRTLVALGGDSPLAWAAGEVLGHPLAYLAACGQRLWSVLALHPVLFALAAGSCWLLRERRGLRLVALLAATYAAVHCLMPVKPLYFGALWPLVAVLAAAPLAWAFDRSDGLAAPFAARVAGSFGLCAGLLGLYVLFLVAAYPGRAADAGRLARLAGAHPGLACLRSEQGRRALAQGSLQEAIGHFRAAQRLDPGLDHELDLAWAFLAEGGSRRALIWRLDLEGAGAEQLVRAHLLRSLAALQSGEGQAARTEFSRAARQWAGRYDLAMRSTAPDRGTQSRLRLADAGLRRGVDELLRPWPLALQVLLLERFQARISRSLPEARSVARLLGDPERWLGLAEAALGSGDARAAAAALAQALRAKLEAGGRERFCGLCLRLPDARAGSELLARLAQRGSADAVLALAALAQRSGRREESLRQLSRLEGLSPATASLDAAASLYGALGEPARRLRVLERLARLRPRDPGTALSLAALAVDAGLRGQALEQLDKVQALSQDPAFLCRAASLYERLQEPGRSRSLLERVEALTRDPELLAAAADLHVRLKEPVRARTLLERAGRGRPGDARTALRLARLAAEAGDRREALRLLEPLAASQEPEVLSGAASVLGSLAEPGRARDCFEAAARLEPKDPVVLLQLAGLAADMGWNAEAVRILSLPAFAGAEPEQKMFAALLDQRLGRQAQALALCDQLVAAYPDNARYLSNRGVVKALLGRRREAAADLRLAISKEGRLLQSYLSLGVLLRAMGDPGQAARVFDQALSVAEPLDPSLLGALREARGRLPGRVRAAGGRRI